MLRESQVQPLLLSCEDCIGLIPRRRHFLRADRQPAHGTAPTAHQLSPGVPARLGQQNLLYATAARPSLAGWRRRMLQALLGDDPSLAPLKQLWSTAPRATPSSWRRVCDLFDQGILEALGRRDERWVTSPDQTPDRAQATGHSASGPGGSDRSIATGREASPTNRGRDRHRGALAPPAGHR